MCVGARGSLNCSAQQSPFRSLRCWNALSQRHSPESPFFPASPRIQHSIIQEKWNYAKYDQCSGRTTTERYPTVPGFLVLAPCFPPMSKNNLFFVSRNSSVMSFMILSVRYSTTARADVAIHLRVKTVKQTRHPQAHQTHHLR